MKKYLLSILTTILGVSMLHAQAVASFSCDFEDEVQNAAWSLVNGTFAPSIPNKWYIGTAINHGGEKSLYISADGGTTATYTKNSSYVIAYIDVTLPQGRYDLSFDWCAMGDVDHDIDGLYVCWVPDDYLGDSIYLNSNTSTSLSKDIQSCLLTYTNYKGSRLFGSATWQNVFTQITSDGTHYRLAFIWMTSDQMAAANPGACVDNIAIVDSRACPKPTDITVTQEDGQRVRLSWSGTAEQYEVKYYSYTAHEWQTMLVNDTTVVFSDLKEGACDFLVSSLCGEGLRSLTSFYSDYFYYIPENHCIDYLTLDSTNCFIANESVGSSMPVSSLTWSHKKVDFKYQSIGSRHTIHSSPSETDPRTCGMLKTVPDGEIASVRLGNWNKGAEAERMEFKFPVNASVNPVLLLKYAVVLQKPGNTCKPNPGFLMRVLNKQGQLVSKCASADFDFKAAADAEWEVCYPEHTTDEVRWKDWTTVGVDLSEYDGDTLTIQLTTYDCGGSGHYGYAYFTLGCSDGQLTGMSCDVENTRFTAPVGFNYRWYKDRHPETILSRDQIFEVETQDTCHYKVDLMFAQDSTCYFSLTASAQPYQPSADATYRWNPNNCQNEVVFTDLSHVKETNQITGEVTHTNKPVDRVMWDFGDGTTSYERNPKHIFSNEGGPICVKLIAYLSTCVDTLIITDVLPAVQQKADTLYVQQCVGTDYVYSYTDILGQVRCDTLNETGLYTYNFLAFTGCDSLLTVNLTMTDTVFTTIDTMIMRGESYTLGKRTYTESGTYSALFVAASGCDSLVTLHLRVYDFPIVEADTLYSACFGDVAFFLSFHFTQGRTEHYTLHFDNSVFPDMVGTIMESATAIEIPIPTNAKPDIYHGVVTFLDTLGKDVSVRFTFELRYSTMVLTQRWNDVLAVRNADYNGGYDFTEYQWYKNGEPLKGETRSYYYAPGGLDMTAEYAAELLRITDGVRLMTCAFVPQQVTSTLVPDIPTLVEKSQVISFATARGDALNATAQWINMLGNTIAKQYITQGYGLIAPNTAGIYILRIHNDDGYSAVHVIVVM